MTVVVDASVWVSAADPADRYSAVSRAFLQALARERIPILLPAITRLEVGCALARRLRDAKRARTLATRLVRFPLVHELALDEALLTEAIEGTKMFVRAGDALYLAASRRMDAPLVAWDRELVARAGAVTPEQWLAGHR